MNHNELKKMIKKEDIIDAKHMIEKTAESTRPYPIITDEGVAVHGDVNDIQKVEDDYSIKFRVPKSMVQEVPENVKALDNYYIFEVEYNDVSITGKDDLAIAKSILDIQPFIKSIQQEDETGKITVENLTDKEMLDMLVETEDQVIEGIYKIVATFLKVEADLIEYMLPFSVMNVLAKLTQNHPEVFKEADAFFG